MLLFFLLYIILNQLHTALFKIMQSCLFLYKKLYKIEFIANNQF